MADRTGSPNAGSLALEAGDARVEVSAADGGRIASLVIAGRELLVTDRSPGPIGWGAYPMAPWAGRIRRGRFTFGDRVHQLPISMPPHAIHGVVYDRPWAVVDGRTISIELDGRWPFRGRVSQQFDLASGGLTATIRVDAEEPMPVTVGWHPWFRREPGTADSDAGGADTGGADGGADSSVHLAFDAGTMLVRDADGIPTGVRVAPPPGPWDDAFTDLSGSPVLTWPGFLRLELSSTCAWWVVYDMPAHAICVEPQSGPPDAANGTAGGAAIVEPGTPLVHVMRWRWERVADPAAASAPGARIGAA